MSALIPFHFDGAEVRVVLRDKEPWWALPDVCSVLDIANPWNVSSRLDDDEKGLHTMETLGGPQQVAIVNESGLYSLVLTSRKPAAKRFKKWITSEVIPSIRKTGGYGKPALDMTDPAQLAAVAKQLVAINADLKRENERLVEEKADLEYRAGDTGAILRQVEILKRDVQRVALQQSVVPLKPIRPPAPADFIAARDFVTELEVRTTKRGLLCAMVNKSLRAYSLQIGYPPQLDPTCDRLLYNRAVCMHWLANGGQRMIDEHLKRVLGDLERPFGPKPDQPKLDPPQGTLL